MRHAIAAWALFTASFALASLAVRTVSARPVRAASGGATGRASRSRARAGELARALLAFPLVPAVAFALAGPARLPWSWALAFVPPALVAAGACLSGADARRLPRLGWTMMVANLAAAVLLVAGLR